MLNFGVFSSFWNNQPHHLPFLNLYGPPVNEEGWEGKVSDMGTAITARWKKSLLLLLDNGSFIVIDKE